MKTLTLNYSKWRCGDTGYNQLGMGHTALLNHEGYMCCLGQFCLQLKPAIKEDEIFEEFMPSDLEIHIPLLTKKKGEKSSIYYISTEFSETAMSINDDSHTTPTIKINKLRSLLKKYKYNLRVINKPLKA
jgi:hypothetical protein